jgi:hypothetical protein
MAQLMAHELENPMAQASIKSARFYWVFVCAISFFQWRTNGASGSAPLTHAPIGKGYGALACAISHFQWRSHGRIRTR